MRAAVRLVVIAREEPRTPKTGVRATSCVQFYVGGLGLKSLTTDGRPRTINDKTPSAVP